MTRMAYAFVLNQSLKVLFFLLFNNGEENVKLLSDARLTLTLSILVFGKDAIWFMKKPNLHHSDFKLFNGNCSELSTHKAGLF